MLKIRVTKPVNGKTRVTFDDSRGSTGFREDLGEVALEDLHEAVLGAANRWQKVRDDIREARRPTRPIG